MNDSREDLRKDAPFRTGEIVLVTDDDPTVKRWLGNSPLKVLRSGVPKVDNLPCNCDVEEKGGIHRLDCRRMRPRRWWVLIEAFGKRLKLAANHFRLANAKDEPIHEE